ncbi:MAG: hypothetical protein WB710_00270 [Stellaceae bacterium]
MKLLRPCRRQAEKFRLMARRGPGDRPAAFLPILRLRLLHEPGDELIGVHRQPEIGLGLLEGGKKAQRLCCAARQSCECVRLVEADAHVERQPADDSPGN